MAGGAPPKPPISVGRYCSVPGPGPWAGPMSQALAHGPWPRDPKWALAHRALFGFKMGPCLAFFHCFSDFIFRLR